MKMAAVVALAAAATTCVEAQGLRSTYDFLDIPSSARCYGLGGVNIAVIDDDITLAGQNPALIGPETGRQCAFSYMHQMGSSNFAEVKYGQPWGEHGAWAIGLRYLNYGEIDGYDADGFEIGRFSPHDIAVEATYSHDFSERLRGGITLKWAYSQYEQYNAFAMGADLGMNYFDPENDLSLSMVLRNMGGQIKRFEERYDRLPFDIQLGMMKGLGDGDFSIGATIWNLTKWHLAGYEHTTDGIAEVKLKGGFGRNLMRHVILCAQYQPTSSFYATLGYNYKMRSDMESYQRNFLSGFTLGCGLKTGRFGVGVAYAMPHKNASSVLVNLELRI